MENTHKKKRGRYIATVVLAILLLAAVAMVVKNQMGKTYEKLNSTDQKILSELDSYCKANREKSIWKEYELENKPVLLMNGIAGNVYLVNPVKEIKNLFAAKVTMPKDSVIQVYRISRLMPTLYAPKYWVGNFNTIGQTYSVLGNDVYYLKYNKEESLDAKYSSKHFITLLSHEAFHYYMQENWSGGERFSEELSDGDIQLIKEEYEILNSIQEELKKAAPSKESLLQCAREYVSIVEKRINANSEYLNKELAMEVAEGTAQYVGIMASKIVGYDYDTMYFDNTSNVPFADVIPMLEKGGIDKSVLSDRMPYESGSLICQLLAALEVEGWQEQLNNQTLKTPIYLYMVVKDYLAGIE